MKGRTHSQGLKEKCGVVGFDLRSQGWGVVFFLHGFGRMKILGYFFDQNLFKHGGVSDSKFIKKIISTRWPSSYRNGTGSSYRLLRFGSTRWIRQSSHIITDLSEKNCTSKMTIRKTFSKAFAVAGFNVENYGWRRKAAHGIPHSGKSRDAAAFAPSPCQMGFGKQSYHENDLARGVCRFVIFVSETRGRFKLFERLRSKILHTFSGGQVRIHSTITIPHK